MDIMEFRDFCLSLPLAEECTPFDEDTLVFKVGGKMFAYTSISRFTWISVKCEPEKIVEFNERYEYVGGAPNMNKRHWLGIHPQDGAPDSFIKERVRESYRLVVENIPRKAREVAKAAIAETGYKF